MLIDTYVTIAYKCSSCGSFAFFNTSIFSLLYARENSFKCRCGKTSVCVSREGNRDFRVKSPCIGCGSEHIFILERKEIIHRDLNVFHCPVTGMQQCFVGKDHSVRSKIDNLEKELDELIDMFGYDNYFKNTQVMFDSLNKIHDIAEQGNLCCECGSVDIELILLSDRIQLRCKKCTGSRVIKAESNEDLKDILTRQQILLLGDLYPYGSNDGKSLMRKTDGK